MIVEIPKLQAYMCDGCEQMYEMWQSKGREDDLNRALDFKKRLQERHKDCVSKAALEAMPVQASA